MLKKLRLRQKMFFLLKKKTKKKKRVGWQVEGIYRTTKICICN